MSVDTAKPSKPTRRKAMLAAAGVFAAVAGSRALGGLARAQGLVTRTRADLVFDTTVALTVAGADARALDAALDAGMAALRRVEHATSVYKARGDLGRLNRDGRLADPDPHLVTLLTYAAALSRDTAGRFDCTVQPLWNLWADHHARGEGPSAAALPETVARVDWRGVSLSPDEVRLARPGMAVTLNSINQGYAADVVMAELAARGIEHAFVDTGEFGARGRHPDGRDWRLGVVAPRDTASLAFTLDPFRRFAATSGDYMTFFSPDLRDHHIFDPRTLAGIRALVVENDAPTLESTARLLGGWGMVVLAVADPRAIMAGLEPVAPFDVVLADYHLGPKLVGTDVIAAVRAMAGRALPALVVTADHTAEVEALVSAAGCSLVHKPIKPTALRSLLSSLMG